MEPPKPARQSAKLATRSGLLMSLTSSKSLSLNLILIVVAGVFGVAVGATTHEGAHAGTIREAPRSSATQASSPNPQAADPLLALDEPQQAPVITAQTPGATDNQYGFEGGRVVKVGGTYYMFVTELAGTPRWFANRIAYWESTDGVHWTRPQGATLFQSGPDFTGPQAGVFTPIPVYDNQANQWDLFYVAGNPRQIWRAVSTVPGRDGITGPYKDAGIAMAGTDGFMPYSAGGRWYALYEGPSQFSPWEISLATASTLAGPWTPVKNLNPLTVERRFIENPVVTKLANGEYVAVYDSELPGAVGVMYSPDGIHWSRGTPLQVLPKGYGRDADDVRTPLGLVPTGGGSYRILFTGYDTADNLSVSPCQQTSCTVKTPFGDVWSTTVTSCSSTCTIDDSVQGPYFGQFTYDGSGWQHQASAGAFDDTMSVSDTTNDVVTFAFRGPKLIIRGVTGPNEGLGAVTIDGRPAGDANFYSAQQETNRTVWSSTNLGNGEHLVRVRVMGQKDKLSSGYGIAIDAATMVAG